MKIHSFEKVTISSNSVICLNFSLAHIVHCPLHFFYTNPSGRILYKFSKDTGFLDGRLLLMFYFIFYRIFVTLGTTVNSRYNQFGYSGITAYNEMEIFPQSTKCINYYPLITNIRI